MKLRTARVDLNKTKANWPDGLPFAPALLVPADDAGNKDWIVLDAPFNPNENPVWAFTKNDEYLRIPLFSYDLHPTSDLALAFMLQLGLSCAGKLPGKVDQLFIVTGNPVELLYANDSDKHTGIRFWVGFAVTLF
jgi:hypothetical protein